MDISEIKPTATNLTAGIQIGKPDAPHKLVEFINLRCPYCKKWFETNKDLLAEAVAAGKLYQVIKLFDKEKESLQRGNVMHRFITKNDPEKALTEIDQVFQTQETWGDMTLEEVAAYAQNTLGLTEQPDSDTTAAIIAEAEAANIKFVPTVILDQHIFDESIDEATLVGYLA